MVCIFRPFVVLFFILPFLSRTQRINLFTMRNLKFPFHERLDAQMEIPQCVLGLRATDIGLFKTMIYLI